MKTKRFLLLPIALGTFLFLVPLSAGYLWFGGIGQLAAYVNGKAVFISPREFNFGSCDPGTETVAIFHITNLASKEISVLGERSSCNCAFSDQIPILAEPGKTVDIRINVRLPKYDASYDQTITFMIAEPDRLAMHAVRVTATIPHALSRPIETETSVQK